MTIECFTRRAWAGAVALLLLMGWPAYGQKAETVTPTPPGFQAALPSGIERLPPVPDLFRNPASGEAAQRELLLRREEAARFSSKVDQQTLVREVRIPAREQLRQQTQPPLDPPAPLKARPRTPAETPLDRCAAVSSVDDYEFCAARARLVTPEVDCSKMRPEAVSHCRALLSRFLECHKATGVKAYYECIDKAAGRPMITGGFAVSSRTSTGWPERRPGDGASLTPWVFQGGDFVKGD